MTKAKILYIEDNDTQRRTLASGLRTKGYSVSVATSGRTGLRLFNSKEFDVILCDLNMPEMDGLGVLGNIRRKDLDIPFIILSSHGTIPLALKAIKKGANYFVLKPVEINQITITIEQIIEKTKLQKKMQDSHHTLQMVAENVPDIIYSLNAKGEFISISPSAEIALDYKPSEFIGKSVFEIIHPDDRERVKESFVRSIEGTGPKVKTLQFRMVSKTGKIKHFEISRRMVVENGKIIRNDGIARDVTHRVELEQKLQEYSQELINANLEMLETQQMLENKNTEMEGLLNELSKNKDELQTIIDTNPGIIILADNEGIIKASNNGVFDYFGLRPDEIINTRFDEFIAKIKSDVEDFDTFRNYLDECKEAPYCSGEYD
ncbi:MAG: response regulator, partial [Candidatus Aminicenantaceae bacterium]